MEGPECAPTAGLSWVTTVSTPWRSRQLAAPRLGLGRVQCVVQAGELQTSGGGVVHEPPQRRLGRPL